MLESRSIEQKVSTGLGALDEVLEGLYWGDNVVWEVDGASVAPFYRAIAARAETFEGRTFVALTDAAPEVAVDGLEVMRAGPGTALAHPADLLREVHRLCRPGGRRLLLFDSLDRMVEAWGVSRARGFFARCCPMLLDLGAIGYWAMSTGDGMAAVRDTVASVTQCILRLDDRNIRVAKADARSDGVRGSVLHWHEDKGRAVLSPANINGRVAASLRAVRRVRGLSQHDLAQLAGVTASAISQAERAERGLSLGTLAQLSRALGMTIDDLLHGDGPEVYRIGRRPDDPHHADGGITALLGDANSDLTVDLVHLGPRESALPAEKREGTGIVAVASGLIQVQLAGQTPTVRPGEVLVAAGDRVEGWRNIAQSEAMLFWIVHSRAAGGRGR
jgi:transcriptional regulator with XRE-family HTH domain